MTTDQTKKNTAGWIVAGLCPKGHYCRLETRHANYNFEDSKSPQPCPNGTYANSSTLSCDACNSNCSLCDSLPTNCQACSSGFFYDALTSSCGSTCPDGSTGINGTC